MAITFALQAVLTGGGSAFAQTLTTIIAAPHLTTHSSAVNQLAQNPSSQLLNPSESKILQGSVSDIDYESIDPKALTNAARYFEPFFRINDKTLDLEAVVASDKDLGLGTLGTQLEPLPGSSSSKLIMNMQEGKMIFAPYVDTTVKTSFGDVDIDAKSIVMVITSKRGTAVFNFDDLHKDAVRIKAGDVTIGVAPGQHVLVTSSGVNGFGLVNPNEAIGYRGLSETNLANGLKVFRAEFSVPSTIGTIKALKALLISRHPSALKLSNHMTKTTAAIIQMKRGADPYQQILIPRVSASSSDR